MMKNNTTVNDIKNNWDDIKSNIKKHWRKLSNEDLEEIEGSYHNLVKKVEEAYELTKEEAVNKVHAYIETLGLTDLEEKKDALQQSLGDKAKMAKDRFEDSIIQSIHKMKGASVAVQEDLSEYVKTNPVKVVGLAVLAGLVTGKLLNLMK